MGKKFDRKLRKLFQRALRELVKAKAGKLLPGLDKPPKEKTITALAERAMQREQE